MVYDQIVLYKTDASIKFTNYIFWIKPIKLTLFYFLKDQRWNLYSISEWSLRGLWI